jgi:hypothetical protein
MLAEHALAEHRTPVQAAVNGVTVTASGDPLTLTPEVAALGRDYRITNRGDRELFATVTVEGVPSEPLPPEAKGASLSRSFFTLDGQPADLAHLRQNDRIIVALSGKLEDGRHHEMVLRDLLPAGLEIEGPVRANDDGATGYDWLARQRFTRLTEARDDRYVASFVVSGNTGYYWGDDDRERDVTFSLAYTARAITPGNYVLPAATIDDMYRPSVRARTAMGSVTIEPR